MPADVSLLILRHGQSEWNAVQRWQGSADSPLTALGREQAVESAWVLAGCGTSFDGVWSSALQRAAETAAIIADALALPAPTVDARLGEAFAGEWEGLTPQEIEAGWPGWLADHRRPPAFEAFADVIERVFAGLDEIAASTQAAALVVAHSGVIRSIVRELGAHDERVPNLGGIWLTASWDGDRSPVSAPRYTLAGVFDPDGIVVSGVDAPGEDPGDGPGTSPVHGRSGR